MGRKIIFDFQNFEAPPKRSRSKRYGLIAGGLMAALLLAVALAIPGKNSSRNDQTDLADAGTAETTANPDVSENPTTTIVHNGVTVVTPQLLVPVVPGDAGVAATVGVEKAKGRVRHRSARTRLVNYHATAPWFNPVSKKVARF